VEADPIIDAIPAHVWCVRADGSTQFANRAWLDYAGGTREGADFRGSIFPEDLERFDRAFASGDEVDIRLRRHDGQYRWFLVRIAPVDGGRRCGTSSDIHDLKLESGASERMARSQVEALKQALDSIAMDASSDRLAQHIARTITEQLGAHSSSVWRRSEATDSINFEFAFEGGRFVTKSDAIIAGLSLLLPMEEAWPWIAPFREGRHCLIEDIRSVPPFPLRDRLIAIGIVTVLMVPMLVAGRLEGAFVARFSHRRPMRPSEIEFAQTLANQAVLAMQLTQLSAESRVSAVIEERNRMARDIHDTLAQGFTGVIVQLEAAEDARLRGLGPEADEHLHRARDMARESLREARRSVHALRPQALEENDLCEALDAMFTRMTAGTALRSEFSFQGDPCRLPGAWEEDLLRIGQEAITNVLRHASATNFEARITFERERTRLDFRDDGRGFDPARKRDGLGLVGMHQRVERMAGTLEIRSAPGEGVVIAVTVPLSARP
jgi:signal transduction histidine kinase